MRTISCAHLLGERGADVTPAKVARDMEVFLRPFLSSAGDDDDGTEDIEKLRNIWYQLCKNAFDLALMLRRSRDLFTWEFLEPGQEVDTREATILARESLPNTAKGAKGPGAGPGNVLYTVSGALVRYPDHSTTRRTVMEKAQVVVRPA